MKRNRLLLILTILVVIVGILFIVIGIILITMVEKVNLTVVALAHLIGAVAVIFNSARLVRFGEHLEPHTQQS